MIKQIATFLILAIIVGWTQPAKAQVVTFDAAVVTEAIAQVQVLEQTLSELKEMQTTASNTLNSIGDIGGGLVADVFDVIFEAACGRFEMPTPTFSYKINIDLMPDIPDNICDLGGFRGIADSLDSWDPNIGMDFNAGFEGGSPAMRKFFDKVTASVTNSKIFAEAMFFISDCVANPYVGGNVKTGGKAGYNTEDLSGQFNKVIDQGSSDLSTQWDNVGNSITADVTGTKYTDKDHQKGIVKQPSKKTPAREHTADGKDYGCGDLTPEQKAVELTKKREGARIEAGTDAMAKSLQSMGKATKDIAKLSAMSDSVRGASDLRGDVQAGNEILTFIGEQLVELNANLSYQTRVMVTENAKTWPQDPTSGYTKDTVVSADQ